MPVFLFGGNGVEYSRHIMVNASNIKYLENPLGGNGIVPCGWAYGRIYGQRYVMMLAVISKLCRLGFRNKYFAINFTE